MSEASAQSANTHSETTSVLNFANAQWRVRRPRPFVLVIEGEEKDFKGHEGAERAGDDEGDHDAGPGELGSGSAGQDEDTRPDDAADTEQGEIQCPEGTLEFTMFMLGLDLGDGLASENPPIGHLCLLVRPAPAGHVRGTLASIGGSGNV
jgi:hypothetical protein